MSRPATSRRALTRRIASWLAGALLLAACSNSTSTSTSTIAANDDALALAAAVNVIADGCSGLRPTMGGGSFVGDGLVLTVAHVVAGAKQIHVELADESIVPAVLVGIDRAKDLAVLRVDASVAPLAIGAVAVGAQGSYVVYRDDDAAVAHARVESFVDLDVPNIDRDGSTLRRGYQLTATVRRGDSGTIVVSGGKATAVIFATSTETGARTWATDIAEATPLLQSPAATAVDGGDCT